MAIPHVPVSEVRRWTAVHLRRHVPLVIYTAGTAAAMAWTLWLMTHLG